MSQRRTRAVSSWIEDAKREREVEEDLLACRLIVLKIVRFMKDNHFSQKQLAEMLDVSPQYINKFLHGQDLDMKVSTVLRYGRILGIKLLEVPGLGQRNSTWFSFGSIKVGMTTVQPASFDYEGASYGIGIPSFRPSMRKGVVYSDRPVS